MTTIKKKIRKSNKKRILFNQKGMALITTLIFIFILVTFVVALLTMTSSDSRLSTLQRESTRAFYLADAGIEEAFWKLNTAVEDGGEEILTWRPTDYPNPGTATEYYQVTIENTGVDDPTADPPTKVTDKIKITSTGVVIGGKFSSGKRKIEVTAEIDYIYKTVYDYAILAEKIILFQGTPGPDVVGDVHSNDDILVSGHFADTYPEGSTATCSGDTNDINPDNTGAKGIDLPFVDYPEFKSRAEDLDDPLDIHYHIGDVILGNGDIVNWTGIHYIEGNLEAKNGSEIHVTNGAIIVSDPDPTDTVAEGNVDIKEGAIFNINNDDDYLDPEDPNTAIALAAQGNIKIYAKSEIGIGVVQSVLADGVTAEGFIELKNGCEVTGSVIADTVYLRNKSIVNYGTGLSEFTTKGDPFYKKTSWRETY